MIPLPRAGIVATVGTVGSALRHCLVAIRCRVESRAVVLAGSARPFPKRARTSLTIAPSVLHRRVPSAWRILPGRRRRRPLLPGRPGPVRLLAVSAAPVRARTVCLRHDALVVGGCFVRFAFFSTWHSFVSAWFCITVQVCLTRSDCTLVLVDV